MTSPTTNKEPLKKDSPEIEEPKKKDNFKDKKNITIKLHPTKKDEILFRPS